MRVSTSRTCAEIRKLACRRQKAPRLSTEPAGRPVSLCRVFVFWFRGRLTITLAYEPKYAHHTADRTHITYSNAHACESIAGRLQNGVATNSNRHASYQIFHPVSYEILHICSARAFPVAFPAHIYLGHKVFVEVCTTLREPNIHVISTPSNIITAVS